MQVCWRQLSGLNSLLWQVKLEGMLGLIIQTFIFYSNMNKIYENHESEPPRCHTLPYFLQKTPIKLKLQPIILFITLHMSLTYRKRSVIFNRPKATAYKIQVQAILNQLKGKLKISGQSKSKPKMPTTQKLSLAQAKNIQNLYSQTVASQRTSLNSLIKDYDRNCCENIEEEVPDIDQNRLDLFRQGQYYRSQERARGSGVKMADKQDLDEYFNFVDSGDDIEMSKTMTISRCYTLDRKSKATTSTYTSRIRSGIATPLLPYQSLSKRNSLNLQSLRKF